MKEYQVSLKAGITRTKEFERKLLATHAVNVGLKCGHGCLYCSTPSLLRCHTGFRSVKKNPFDEGYSIVDPKTPSRIREDVHKLKRHHMVMLSTTTDAWSPEAQRFNLGNECLQLLLGQGESIVRVLTKNAAVEDSLQLMSAHSGRVRLSLSLSGPPSRQDIMKLIEPHASSLSERLEALRRADLMGVPTYGMLCPCLPGISDSPKALEEMFGAVMACNPEDIWLEPVNPRGPGLIRCAEVLKQAGFHEEADAMNAIRSRTNWNDYAVNLVKNAQEAAAKVNMLDRLHILIYSKQLSNEGRNKLMSDGQRVVWL